MKSIFDRSFRYTNAASTDIAKTFARIRREQREQQRLQEAAAADAKAKVAPIKTKAGGAR